jgi:hypothetical protein
VIAIWIVAQAIAAGGVVDATVAADARGTAQARLAPSLTLMLRPSVRAALEREGAGVDASYAPQLSLVAPSDAFVALLHTGTVRAEAPLSRRLVLHGSATGAFGDLDPSTAQRTLLASGGLLDGADALPYAAAAGDLGARVKVRRGIDVDVAGAASYTGSPAASAGSGTALLGTTAAASFGANGVFVTGRTSALLADLRLRAAERRDDPLAPDADPRFAGASASLGWRTVFGRGLSLDVAAGALTAVVDPGDGVPVATDRWFGRSTKSGNASGLVALPEGAVRAVVGLDLAGASALEALVEATLTAATDPLGALLEERLTAAAGLSWRVTRSISARGRLSSFVPVEAFAGVTAVTASGGVDGGLSFALSPDVALETGLIGTMRLVEDASGRATGLQGDATALLSLTATETLFHTGSRPRGSDPRPGRSVGERRIGDPPRPSEIEEPPPLTEPEDEEPEVPEVPPELVVPGTPSGAGAPSIQSPLPLGGPLPPPTREMRKEDRERRDREEQERKKRPGATSIGGTEDDRDGTRADDDDPTSRGRGERDEGGDAKRKKKAKGDREDDDRTDGPTRTDGGSRSP